MSYEEWFNPDSGFLIKQIPDAVVSDCSHQGECYDDCQHWVRKLGFEAPREKALWYLKQTGGWEEEELAEWDDEELMIRVLWIACCDIQEAKTRHEQDPDNEDYQGPEWAWGGLTL